MARMLSRSVGVALVLLLVGAASASSQSDQVTLFVTLFRSINSGALEVRFSGVANGAPAGEVVDVLGRECGARPGDVRLIAQTQTRAGGGYLVESHGWTTGMEFRARWNDRLSDPYVLRRPAHLWVTKVPKRPAWRVGIFPPNAFVSMKGKVVVLQRQRGGRWLEYQRAKLKLKPSSSSAYSHEVRFNVPKRGLKLRAVLSAASAAPCYLKTITAPWRS
jgi:hypothetical protein